MRRLFLSEVDSVMQAIVGERVEAQGKIELVTNKKSGKEHYRLILGNKPQDYMVLLH